MKKKQTQTRSPEIWILLHFKFKAQWMSSALDWNKVCQKARREDCLRTQVIRLFERFKLKDEQKYVQVTWYHEAGTFELSAHILLRFQQQLTTSVAPLPASLAYLTLSPLYLRFVCTGKLLQDIHLKDVMWRHTDEEDDAQPENKVQLYRSATHRRLQRPLKGRFLLCKRNFLTQTICMTGHVLRRCAWILF